MIAILTKVRILTIMCLLCSLFSPKVEAIELDKVAHFATSYVIADGTYIACNLVTSREIPCLIAGIALSGTAGAIREFTMGGNRDKGDMLANGLGIAAASVRIVISF